MRQASLEWRRTGPEQRAAYEQASAPDKARYLQEMNIWKEQRAYLRRPASAYALFLKDTWNVRLIHLEIT